jgi:4,5-DOPA dioxygenase extradiol
MTRKHFLSTVTALPLGAIAMNLKEFAHIVDDHKPTERMPVLFIGHGSPMNALWDNSFTQGLAKIGAGIEKPNAILVISAHWLTRGTYVASNPKPATIHDFGGFPKELFDMQYPAAGAPELAKELASKIPNAHVDDEWGLDHGAWTVLKHMYPNAEIPVFQMSIDYSKPESYHLDLANHLNYLRSKGVLILGSGNIVHNLRLLNWQNRNSGPFDWALEFDTKVKGLLDKGDFQALSQYRSWGKFADLAVPTNDHYLPMMYTLGASQKNEEVKHLFEGFEMGSISQRCFVVT